MKKFVYKSVFLLSLFLLSSCAQETNNPPVNNDETTYYTVEFDSNGGSEVHSQRVREGNPVVRPDSPTREGFSFIGWYEENTFVNQWNFDTDRVYSNLTLYARWQDLDEVSYTESLVFELDEESNSYIVTDVGDEADIIIPSTYNDLPVTRIQGAYGTGAFARKDIVSVTIPDSIIEIGQNSFNNCSSLTTVNISETSQLEIIGRNAFSGCSSLTSIYIPSGVYQILDSAFNNCGSIESFVVSDENETYESLNGHLIERESRTLIRGSNNYIINEGVYILGEASFRRVQNVESLYIPHSVIEIGNYFIADSSITKLEYNGTEEEWNSISKTDVWNYGNRDVNIVFYGPLN